MTFSARKPFLSACLSFYLGAATVHVAGRAQSLQLVQPSQPTQSAITLEPPTGWELQTHLFDSSGKRLAEAPPNFRRLGEATMSEPAEVHTLTLRFTADTTLTGISSTPDFPIQGGSCVKGNTYQRGTTCAVLVRFTPQGPGNRLGHLTIARSGSATPDSIGLSGSGYAPVLSFIPSVIQTVPGTFVSGAGLLKQARNLATDGGDRLFIADFGNGIIRMIDSSGTIASYSSPGEMSQPYGITVDAFGNVWSTSLAGGYIREFVAPNSFATFGPGGTDICTAGTPACTLAGETLTRPGELSSDSYGSIFFSEAVTGAAASTVQPVPDLLRLYNSFALKAGGDLFASDPYDHLYSYNPPTCQIMTQTLDDAANHNPSIYRVVVGSGLCGFSGDGGDARNAEIGGQIGQFAFDALGDLYFTDMDYGLVRRVDFNTGIIRTIAGNGFSGYDEDGGPATAAEVDPTGIAVDSQGQVYVINWDEGNGQMQAIRKVTNQGILAFGNQARNSSSPAHILTVTNTGNIPMVLTGFAITGANPDNFSVDPSTTSCNLSNGASLLEGDTCIIGVIFTPSGAGPRSAKLVFADNTVTNSNTALLNGTGTLASATLSITSPALGTSFPVGKPVNLTAAVGGSSFGLPTGTIRFQVDGANYGSPVSILSGAASTTVTGLSVSAGHTLSAIYSGDANYAPAGPVSVLIAVTAPTVASRVSLVPILPAKGAAVSDFAVSVAGDDGIVPSGQVELRDGSKLIAAAQLTNGHALLRSPLPSPGAHSLTAAYLGDGRHSPAVSPLMLEVVTSGGQCSPTAPAPHPLFQP
jgi:hypothetical protein